MTVSRWSNAIRERLAEKVEFVAADSEDAQMILIVTGCSTACAKLDNVSERPHTLHHEPGRCRAMDSRDRVREYIKRSRR